MFNKVEDKNRSRAIIDQIQALIMNGELKAGDQLPSERELAQTLDVGRPALREALRALELIGLIEMRHGQGNFIADDMLESCFKPLSLAFQLSEGKPEHILQLRYAIEVDAVRLAAQEASPEIVQALYGYHLAMIQAATNEEKAHCDRMFHYQIARAANNPLISALLESIGDIVELFVRRSVTLAQYEDAVEDSLDAIYAEHLSIIRCIAAGDAIGAAGALSRHLGTRAKQLQQYEKTPV